MISLQNINLSFDKPIFSNFSYNFSSTGLYYVVGKSGVGKSTLFRILNCDNLNYYGKYFFDSIEVNKLTKNERNEIKKNITYLSVKDHAYTDYSLIDNLKLILKDEYNEDKVFELFERYDLTRYKKTKFKKLSAGEKQRFLLLIPFLKEQNVILIDELFSNLDEYFTKIYRDLYLELSKSSLVIIIEHNLDIISDEGTVISLPVEGNKSISNISNQFARVIKPKKLFKSSFLLFIMDLKKFKITYIIDLLNVLLISILVVIFCLSSSNEVERQLSIYEGMPFNIFTLYDKDEEQLARKKEIIENYNLENNLLRFYSLQNLRVEVTMDYTGLDYICPTDKLMLNGKLTTLKDDTYYISDYIYDEGLIAKDKYIIEIGLGALYEYPYEIYETEYDISLVNPKSYETIFVSTKTFEKIIEYSDETFYDPQSKINFSSNTFQGLGDTNKEHIQNGHFIAGTDFISNYFNITEEESLALDGTLVELDLTSYGYPFKKELIFNMFPSGFRFPGTAYLPGSVLALALGTLYLSDDDYKIIKDSINYDILKDPYLIYEDYYYISDIEESSTLIFELLATENAPGNLIFKGVYYFNLKSYNNFIDLVKVYSYFISIVLILLIFIGLIFKSSLFSKVSLKYNYTFKQIFLASIFKGLLQILLMIPISYLLYNLIKGLMQKSFYFVYENILLSILVIFILSLSYFILKQIGNYVKLKFIASKRLF